jgi:hypothetical protein
MRQEQLLQLVPLAGVTTAIDLGFGMMHMKPAPPAEPFIDRLPITHPLCLHTQCTFQSDLTLSTQALSSKFAFELGQPR